MCQSSPSAAPRCRSHVMQAGTYNKNTSSLQRGPPLSCEETAAPKFNTTLRSSPCLLLGLRQLLRLAWHSPVLRVGCVALLWVAFYYSCHRHHILQQRNTAVSQAQVDQPTTAISLVELPCCPPTHPSLHIYVLVFCVQDRSKKREASVRRCKALVEALVAVQLGLDDGVSAIPDGTPRQAFLVYGL